MDLKLDSAVMGGAGLIIKAQGIGKPPQLQQRQGSFKPSLPGGEGGHAALRTESAQRTQGGEELGAFFANWLCFGCG